MNEISEMKKHIANAVAGIRILGSILLVFIPIFSVLFYAMYLICGLSDMIDGTIARKNDSASSFGAKLDTIADCLFTVVSLTKLLPHIPISGWLWLWIAVIALIKVVNMGLRLIELQYSAVVICSIATFSAIQEGYFIGTGRMLVMGRGRKKTNKN